MCLSLIHIAFMLYVVLDCTYVYLTIFMVSWQQGLTAIFCAILLTGSMCYWLSVLRHMADCLLGLLNTLTMSVC